MYLKKLLTLLYLDYCRFKYKDHMDCLASAKHERSHLSKKKKKKARGPENLGIKGRQWNLATQTHFSPSVCGRLAVTEIITI